jgi:hypothetical protein
VPLWVRRFVDWRKENKISRGDFMVLLQLLGHFPHQLRRPRFDVASCGYIKSYALANREGRFWEEEVKEYSRR